MVAQLILRSSNYWSQYEAFSRVGSHGVGFAGVRPLSQVLKDPFEFTGQAWSAYRPAFLDYVTIPLLVAALLGVVLGWRSERRLTALLVAWIVVPFGVALTFGTLSFPRHVMYVVPPILVFGALTLVRAAEVVVRAVPGWPGKLACGLGIAVILGPALVADARVLAHPDTAHYAGPDDVQYVTGTQAGRPWPDVRDLIRRRATGQRVDIVLYRSYPDVLRWLLPNDSRYRFLQTSSPLARDAQFLVRDESNFVFPNDPGEAVIRQGGFSLIGRFPRPRGGAVVRLYERAGQQGS